MREENLTRFLSNDFSEHPIVKYHTILSNSSLKHGKMWNVTLLFRDVSGREHLVRAGQHAAVSRIA
jgi:hypothetical protein